MTGDWRQQGACVTGDDEKFFSSAAPDVEAALAVCGVCSVTVTCLNAGLQAGWPGVWGGTTPDDRAGMRPRAGVRRLCAPGRDSPPPQWSW